MAMFKSLFVIVVAMLVLSSCKKDEAKAYSAGCEMGIKELASMIGMGIKEDALAQHCAEQAQKYVQGK
jgi:hypothetical protein